MNTDKSEYLVGELAEYFGVSNDTLRLYDKRYLLPRKRMKQIITGLIRGKILSCLNLSCV